MDHDDALPDAPDDRARARTEGGADRHRPDRAPANPAAWEPCDRPETGDALRRRRRVVGVTSLVGAGLLGAGLSTKPDSPAFYGFTLATAATWVVGGLASGRLPLGHQRHGDRLVRPVVTPVLAGAGAFGAFYAAALVARRIPVLDRAISSVLRYSGGRNDGLVLLTTIANGVAEEVFFRGALYDAVGGRHPIAASTGLYMLATTATRNPALVLASGVMGVLFAAQRRSSGGIQAPALTHLTWSVLMLRYLPPLFDRAAGAVKAARPSSSRSTSASSV